jgi:hypothetical protein
MISPMVGGVITAPSKNKKPDIKVSGFLSILF